MQFSDSIFAARFNITRHDLEGYLAEALSQGGDYADLYFEYLADQLHQHRRIHGEKRGARRFHGGRRAGDLRRAHRLRLQRRPFARKRSARPPWWPPTSPPGPSKVEKFDLQEGRQPQSVSGADRAHRNGIRRARGTGETRRPRGPRLRSAHLPGAGHVCRQPAPGHGSHQRGAPHARPPAPGPPQRRGPGAAERRHSAARPRRRRRTRGARTSS